ncbi:hypothetical protein niasHT_011110 [Heterodera trifolii]|uniref:Uncharacterized protein n=1 Tax=Heterodera trifolii TaxID=157864 RepID=A0ABD2L9K5_9BILA
MQIIDTATGASHEEDIQAELCTLENRYCVTVTCQMGAKMEFTQWACYPHNNKAMCIEYHTTKLKEKFENENIRCNCKFGKANEEMANDPLFKNSESDMYWGCVESKNCEAIAAEKSMYSRKNLTCQCGFGEENVEMGNENLTIPLWEPPTNIEFTEIEINACKEEELFKFELT